MPHSTSPLDSLESAISLFDALTANRQYHRAISELPEIATLLVSVLASQTHKPIDPLRIIEKVSKLEELLGRLAPGDYFYSEDAAEVDYGSAEKIEHENYSMIEAAMQAARNVCFAPGIASDWKPTDSIGIVADLDQAPPELVVQLMLSLDALHRALGGAGLYIRSIQTGSAVSGEAYV